MVGATNKYLLCLLIVVSNGSQKSVSFWQSKTDIDESICFLYSSDSLIVHKVFWVIVNDISDEESYIVMRPKGNVKKNNDHQQLHIRSNYF
jgi:hypothetical protein